MMRYLLPTWSISKPCGQDIIFCYYINLLFTNVLQEEESLLFMLGDRINCYLHRWELWGIHKLQCQVSHMGFFLLRSQLVQKCKLHRNISTTEKKNNNGVLVVKSLAGNKVKFILNIQLNYFLLWVINLT